jgi:hypothetical protein
MRIKEKGQTVQMTMSLSEAQELRWWLNIVQELGFLMREGRLRGYVQVPMATAAQQEGRHRRMGAILTDLDKAIAEAKHSE